MNNCERCNVQLDDDPDSPYFRVPVVYGETDMVICRECAVELTLLIGNWLVTTPVKVQRVHSEKIKAYWRERMESKRRHLDRWGIPYTFGEHDDDGGFSITRYDSESDVPTCAVEGCTQLAKHEVYRDRTYYLCAEHFEHSGSLDFTETPDDEYWETYDEDDED